MDITYCTIITPNYIHYAVTLFESLIEFKKDIKFYIAISAYEIPNYKIEDNRIKFISAQELKIVDSTSRNIHEKYFKSNNDHYRWSMKPILLKYLLSNISEKAIFLDCDLHFCNSFDFLAEELNKSRFLLTPHWKTINIENKFRDFSLLMTDGLYNAGFIGVNRAGIEILDWWAKACAFKCERNYTKGIYDDQKYLNIIPIYYKGVKVIKHKGCNLASWNTDVCRRMLNEKGIISIKQKYAIIFIHMTNRTVSLIESGEDKLLGEFLKKWKSRLDENSIKFDINRPEKKNITNTLLAFIYRNLNKLSKIKVFIQN